MRELISNLTSGEFKKVYRYDFYGRRIYFDADTGNEYSGLTGAMDACTFKGDQEQKQLGKWRDSFIATHGQQGYKDYLDATADFGSLIHYGLVWIKDEGKINWRKWNKYAKEYFEAFYREKGMYVDSGLVQQQINESAKHMCSLMQWIHERVEDIAAIEVPAMWDRYRICTPIDVTVLCKPTPKAKAVWTTVNIKTSSQVSQKQLDQAAIENYMWNSTYNLKCPNTAIVRVKDWKTEPSYEMKTVDNIVERVKEWDAKFSIGRSLFSRPATITEFVGETKLGELPVIKLINLKDYHENYDNLTS